MSFMYVSSAEDTEITSSSCDIDSKLQVTEFEEYWRRIFTAVNIYLANKIVHVIKKTQRIL